MKIFLLFFCVCLVSTVGAQTYMFESEIENVIVVPDSVKNSELSDYTNMEVYKNKKVDLGEETYYYYPSWFMRSSTMKERYAEYSEVSGKNVVITETKVYQPVFAWENIVVIVLWSIAILFICIEAKRPLAAKVNVVIANGARWAVVMLLVLDIVWAIFTGDVFMKVLLIGDDGGFGWIYICTLFTFTTYKWMKNYRILPNLSFKFFFPVILLSNVGIVLLYFFAKPTVNINLQPYMFMIMYLFLYVMFHGIIVYIFLKYPKREQVIAS